MHADARKSVHVHQTARGPLSLHMPRVPAGISVHDVKLGLVKLGTNALGLTMRVCSAASRDSTQGRGKPYIPPSLSVQL